MGDAFYETSFEKNSEPQNIESAGGGNDEVRNRCALTISDNYKSIETSDVQVFPLVTDNRLAAASLFIATCLSTLVLSDHKSATTSRA
jgi:hypothetical protein